MRVIAGKARRLMLKSSPGFDTRPTLDKIKETLFNILQPDIPGSRFLDLFSGSGSIGIEALSRGASQCVFVENNRKALQCILDNLEHTHLEEDAVVIGKSVLGAISELALRKFAFDIVYIDPPYQAGYEQETLRALAQTGIISPETQVVLETDLRNQLDFIEESDFLIVREKNYKTNKHLFLRLKG
ncbi:MAG: 16S rRNA (guanine(966)-N(2))-methyltransferase RsmD [Parasporobacterium sp.]|nr:16S rRNA (guanine(966)-N(2))-methyltransferase RsmD [Parasporobacterium sp.]